MLGQAVNTATWALDLVALRGMRRVGGRRASATASTLHGMPEVHRLSRRDARRIAVTAQALTKRRPSDLFDVVRRLTMLQLDLTSAVAPSADLVLWSRLGTGYDPEDLANALAGQELIELRGMIRPPEDIALFTAEMAAWPEPGRGPHGELKDWEVEIAEWVRDNDECRRDVLEHLRADGPLPTAELPDTIVRPWRSSGWNNNKTVSMLLDKMVQRGEVAVSAREGRKQLWDLAERVYPDDPPVPLEETFVRRAERRLSALGIARATGTEIPGEQNTVGEVGERASIDSVRGEWRVDPAYLPGNADGIDAFEGRAALLSPLDRLVFDRKRMTEIFDFDYQLEMYKPAAKRRWGYYALPVLYGDRLVGKLDATADRKEGVLRVDALHEDQPFAKTMRTAVEREIRDLAAWLGLEVLRLG